MSHTTRREFLATTSLALASQMLTARPARTGWSRLPANALLPNALSDDTLRALATHAIDAAKDAGAMYADIRLAERHWMSLYMGAIDPLLPTPRLEATLTFGVRVIIDGASAFVYGAIATPDTLATAARNAVRTARGYAGGYARGTMQSRGEGATLPGVTGEWTTPYEIDPFTVPLEDQAAVLGAYRTAALRVLHGGDSPKWGVQLEWIRERRVFASTEGSLVTQALLQSEPRLVVAGNQGLGDYTDGVTYLMVPDLMPRAGGFETVADPAVQDNITRVTEEAVRLASLPRRTLDVGRYTVVFDGMAFGATLGQTLGPALELDRAAGLDRDAAGESFLSPPLERLGTQIASPLLSVTGNRAMPSVCAVQWDDDGVAPREYDCIRDGRLMNYHTSRETAPLLYDWYNSQGIPMQSNGCAVAPKADHPVLVRTPHLTVAPASRTASLEDLCRDIGRGILVRGIPHFSIDHQFVSASYSPQVNGYGDFGECEMFEIERGAVVRRVKGNGLEFATPKFLKSVIAMGDQTTTQRTAFRLYKGNPWDSALQSNAAAAGVVKDINVILADVQL